MKGVFAQLIIQMAIYVYGRLNECYRKLITKIGRVTSVHEVKHFGPWGKTVRHLGVQTVFQTLRQ